ncbi:putative imidazolonepropionase, partial [Clonorchis sinensis]
MIQLKGASYMEIHEAGGGINYTVSKTSAADESTLYSLLRQRLLGMIRKGTTTVECKTGYGLHWSVEEKLLRVLNRAKMELPIDMSITFLSAHSVPKDSNAPEFTEHIVSEQIPKLKNLIQQNISVDNIDVFCEKGVYDIEQSARILRAGKSIGLNLNFHADELSDTGGAELAGWLDARAASHLEEASPAGVAAMAASGTAAVLLPTTAHLLRLRPPSARAMIQAGVPVALGTDFNPNAYCLSMPIVMYLACTTLGMTPEEALAGATINAAYSLNMSDRVGAITVGRQADIVVLNCD